MTALTIQHLIDTFSAAHATAPLSVAPCSCSNLLTSIIQIRDKATCTPIGEMLPGRCPVAACLWQVHCLVALGSSLYLFSALCTTHCNPFRLHAQGPLYLQRAISACHLLFIGSFCSLTACCLYLPCFNSLLSASLTALLVPCVKKPLSTCTVHAWHYARAKRQPECLTSHPLLHRLPLSVTLVVVPLLSA